MASEPGASARPAIPEWASALALVALVAAVYWQTLWNGFISDDLVYVEGTRALDSLGGLRDIWLRIGTIPQYYPLIHTSFWFEYQLWGLDPAGYHAVNMAVHALVSLLIWRLLLRLAVPGAWLAAAIFAVHPVHVETVAWASERKNLFSAAFALGSMLAYLRFAPATDPPPARSARKPAWGFYALSLVLYGAALLSKSVTVTMPAALLVIRWWKRGELRWSDLRPLLPFFGLGLPLALLTVWMEWGNVGAVGDAWKLSPMDRILIAGRAAWFYAEKLFFPHPLGFAYPRWRIDAQAPWQYLFPAAALAATAALWVLRARIGRGPLAAVLLFVGILVPALGFFDVYPFVYSFVADHYQYHASVALIALAVAGATMAAHRIARSGGRAVCFVGIALALAAVSGLAFLARKETFAYRDEVTLIRRTVENQPEAWAGHYRLGTVLQNERRHEEALRELREALRLFPEHAVLHRSLGLSLVALGRREEAADAFERALAGDLIDDDRRMVLFQLGNLRALQRRFFSAIELYRAAAALAPDAAEIQFNLAQVLHEDGKRAEALEAMRRAVEIAPGVADAQNALGTMLLASGEAEAALEPLRIAVQLAPEDASFRESLASAYNRLGAGLEEQGDLASAVARFRAALAVDPGHAGAAGSLERVLEAERERGRKP